jgi:putative ABC transport system substrate-binding protein
MVVSRIAGAEGPKAGRSPVLDIGRRKFITLIGGAAAWPHGVLAQGTAKRPLVALLWWASQNVDPGRTYLQELLTGMRELGYIEGQDFDIVNRGAEGHVERLPTVAAELVELKPSLIVASATIQALAAKRATSTIPIVVPVLADPISLGLIESERRPGGNVTGIAPYVNGLPAKQLELAREIVPGATRIGLLDDVTDPKAHPQRQEIEAAGQALKVRIVTVEARTGDDIEPAYEALVSERVEVVIVEQSNMLLDARRQIAQAAATRKLPSVYGYREHVLAGGLVSYGVNLKSCFHHAAYYVDRILKGAKPADLPVEFPTRVELIINLKAAKTLGLEVPPTLLARADEVIE